MGWKVSVPWTRCFVGSLGSVPTPWQRRPSSLEYDVSHVALYSGCRRSWRCSRRFPVAVSRTGHAVALLAGSSSAKAAKGFVVWVNRARVRVAIGASLLVGGCLRCRVGTVVHSSADVGGFGEGVSWVGTPGGAAGSVDVVFDAGVTGCDGRRCTPGDVGRVGTGGSVGVWSVNEWRMVRRVSIAVCWAALGPVGARFKVVLMSCRARIILSSGVMVGLGTLCGRNLTASLMVSVLVSFVRTR